MIVIFLYYNNRELEDESSDESDTEMDTDAQTVTSKGKHDLMMKSEVSTASTVTAIIILTHCTHCCLSL